MPDMVFSDALKQLMDEFTRSGIREIHVRKAEFELYLSTEAAVGRSFAAPLAGAVAKAQPVPLPAPSALAKAAAPPEATGHGAPAAATALPDGAIIITAPNLGTFYRAPKPGAPNYVEVGSRVEEGDELCLIEVMKLFTALRSGQGGRIHSVLVEDGAMVEGGQPLFALVKD